MIWTKLKNNWPLLVLVLLQGLVLFYDFFKIPFSHDELSAIDRCRFGNFNELIQQGIMPDGHPAGVQLFLYALIHWFGIHEWILKLPFVLAGIGSLYLIYQISISFFNRYAAITACIIFIFQSYYISQIVVARPYSFGLFFTLGIVYFCLKIKNHPSVKLPYLYLFIFTLGAFYAHYFSFLQSLIILFCFYVFYYERFHSRYFYFSVLAAILCFIPHIGITIHQLGMGGLDWLSTPTINFFSGFIYQYFNSSYVSLIVGVLLFGLGIVVKCKSKKTKPILLLLILLPIAVLYSYSIISAPVLQAPALFFCTPYLLILGGNGINYFKKYFKISLILFLGIYSGYVLIVENRFYSLRNYQPIEKFVLQSQTNLKNNKPGKTLVIWSGNSHYIAYYLKKHNFQNSITVTDTLKNIAQINLKDYDAVICNQLAPQLHYTLKNSFPFVQSREDNLLYTCMTLNRASSAKKLYSDPVKLQFAFDTASEWSKVSYQYKLDSLIKTPYHFIEFKPLIDSTINGAELVLETYKGEERIDWRSVYLEPGQLLTLKVKDVIKGFTSDLRIKLYIWNSDKVFAKPIEVIMLIRADNPSEYKFKPN
jgi:hypothetical protein